MRLVTRSALICAASLLAADASAGTGDANRSLGSADLSWSTRTPIVGPKSGKLGDPALQVQVSANIDPPNDASKPLLAVAMKSVLVEATWADAKSIELAIVDGANASDGSWPKRTLSSPGRAAVPSRGSSACRHSSSRNAA